LIVCSLADKFTFQRFISHVRATEIQQFRRLCFSSISIVRPALLAYTCLVLTLHKIVGSLALSFRKNAQLTELYWIRYSSIRYRLMN